MLSETQETVLFISYKWLRAVREIGFFDEVTLKLGTCFDNFEIETGFDAKFGSFEATSRFGMCLGASGCSVLSKIFGLSIVLKQLLIEARAVGVLRVREVAFDVFSVALTSSVQESLNGFAIFLGLGALNDCGGKALQFD